MLESPKKPVTVILGGAKVKDKIMLINNLLERYLNYKDRVDKMIITGGMAFTFLKAMNLMKIGKSIFDEAGLKLVGDLITKAKERNVEMTFPEDFVIAKEIKDNTETKIVQVQDGIPDDWLGIDTGPLTQKRFNDVIGSSKTIFLNGAAGVFECNVARSGSVGLINVIIYCFIKSICDATKRGAISICGGGDTINLVNSVSNASSTFSHCSTGGGASLELLEGKELPGIKSLSDLLI